VRIALTIAGSDSGGGAGIQGDLKTFAYFDVYGTSVITAVTAQNSLGVTAWEPVSAALVRKQWDAVLDDLPPQAVKSGMLGSVSVVRTLVQGVFERRPEVMVVDPVMVSTSGSRLLDAEGVALVREQLLPFATLVTPNLNEAEILLGIEIRQEDDMRRAAEAIVRDLGAHAALVTGGHGHGDEVVDVLYDGDWHVARHLRSPSRHTHGTGCTLSAAITANLALGKPLVESVEIAREYVQRAIAMSPGLGGGHGPLNHFPKDLAEGTA
jgi:hydroxymethylpyrimidine/phosphomethylpyrimidine kinase